MKTQILFFAQLKELLGCPGVEMSLDTPLSVAELRSKLIEEYPEWKAHLQSGQVLQAVNHTLVNNEALVQPGDEVAFFPPVTGG
ncbi:molybdopterin converting factor subunit 1 [Pseudoalteromonas gelatinilytica]